MKPNRIAAVIAWLLSVCFTALFVMSAGELGYLTGIFAALIVQIILTIGERPIWWFVFRSERKAKIAVMGIVLLLVDGALNGAGIYPGIAAMAKTGLGFMLIDAFSLSATVEKPIALVLALVIGTVLGGLPEYLWEME